MIFGIIYLLGTVGLWWRVMLFVKLLMKVCILLRVQRGLRIGVVLFIVSEVMFFFAFFWAFFHSSLAPTIEIGSIFGRLWVLVFLIRGECHF